MSFLNCFQEKVHASTAKDQSIKQHQTFNLPDNTSLIITFTTDTKHQLEGHSQEEQQQRTESDLKSQASFVSDDSAVSVIISGNDETLSTPFANSDDFHALAESSRRIFSRHVKQQCWKKSGLVPGRDPDRWRLDAVGNPVMQALRGCPGLACHEYDHIVPWSKGGPSVLGNCQLLQSRVNQMKSNHELEDSDQLKAFSCKRRLTESEMDVLEQAVYGSIKRKGLECRNYSIIEAWRVWIRQQSVNEKIEQLSENSLYGAGSVATLIPINKQPPHHIPDCG